MSDYPEGMRITDKGSAVLAIDAVLGRRLEDAVAMYDALDTAGVLASPARDSAAHVVAMKAARQMVENAKSSLLKTQPAPEGEWEVGHEVGARVALDAVIEELTDWADRIERDGATDV